MAEILGDKTIRTSEGLRDMLFDTLDGLRSGSVTPQHAREVCRVSNVIINSILAEIQFHKVIVHGQERGSTPSTVLKLGQTAADNEMPHLPG